MAYLDLIESAPTSGQDGWESLISWVESTNRKARAQWDRAKDAAEGLAQALAFPPWMTSIHVVYRSRERPIVIEVGVSPDWDKPIKMPASIDGFPIEVVQHEPTDVYSSREAE